MVLNPRGPHEMKKYLGIDFGTKRIGIALSDASGSFAFPHTIVPTAIAEKEIKSLCEKETIGQIVIGFSVATNEIENDVQKQIVSFADRITRATGITTVFEREDFSSVEAHRFQVVQGNRDDSAAAIILQRFLDKKKK